MAEDKKFLQPESTEPVEPESGAPKPPRPQITRRDFLIRSNTGAVAIGVMTGTGFASLIQPQAEAQRIVQPSVGTVPIKTRRVTLDIDSRKHEVAVDVRESLWETMNY
ncbi:MAG: hypothetical protein HY647_11175, partial [Acidobacteria bacterium]|nr:hypothetical protein [Acidobacteriota bacterium]